MAKPNHKKTQCLPLEKLKSDELYAVTLSPPDYRNTDTGRVNEVRVLLDYEQKYKEVINYLKLLKHCEMELYPELSPNGRLHFHGYLLVKDVFKFYWRDLYILDRIAYEIDTLDDTEGKYIKYVTKQLDIMHPVHKELGLLYPLKVNMQ